ncbi:PLP-dependent transferase [Oscillibacter ruminantium]|uniref:PLP-dependent transferase n=1 Tax=Oscillibacter ruminantium TaxID=1263547 RepID=UPI00331B0B63
MIHDNHSKNALGALAAPICQASAFAFDSAKQDGHRFAGQEGGFIYARPGTPTTGHLLGLLRGSMRRDQ